MVYFTELQSDVMISACPSRPAVIARMNISEIAEHSSGLS